MSEKNINGITKEDVSACGYVSGFLVDRVWKLIGKIERKEPSDGIINLLRNIDTDLKDLTKECEVNIAPMQTSIDQQIELAQKEDWARLVNESFNFKKLIFTGLREGMGIRESIPFKQLLKEEE